MISNTVSNKCYSRGYFLKFLNTKGSIACKPALSALAKPSSNVEAPSNHRLLKKLSQSTIATLQKLVCCCLSLSDTDPHLHCGVVAQSMHKYQERPDHQLSFSNDLMLATLNKSFVSDYNLESYQISWLYAYIEFLQCFQTGLKVVSEAFV